LIKDSLTHLDCLAILNSSTPPFSYTPRLFQTNPEMVYTEAKCLCGASRISWGTEPSFKVAFLPIWLSIDLGNFANLLSLAVQMPLHRRKPPRRQRLQQQLLHRRPRLHPQNRQTRFQTLGADCSERERNDEPLLRGVWESGVSHKLWLSGFRAEGWEY